MISANVIRGVNELLEERGIRLYPDETFGDMVARTLNLSNQQSEILLDRLHGGATLEDAAAIAEIDPATLENEVIVAIARAVGVTTGSLRN
jgi:hypothetical protein